MTESIGMKTGSPEKDIADLTVLHANGGALNKDETMSMQQMTWR